MERKKGAILILLSTFVLLISIMFFFADRRDKKEFLKFDRSAIDGRIIENSIDQGASVISVGNHKYLFVPIFVDNKPDFLLFAEKGDSIFKPARADTLRLIHHGKTYLYTFEKF